MSTNINSTEQIVEINAGDQITNVNIVSQSTTQVISGEQVVTVDVNAGTIPAAWGSITGTLSNQTDLQNALNAKQNNITLTTTGTTGVATLVGATLNIPNYVSSTKQTEWDSAYNDKINSAEVSGTTTKTLTLTQQDGGIIQASWSDFDTAPVTSVFGRTGDVVATEGDYNINQLGDVIITSATNGQVLKYNGTAWVNAADASGLTSVGLAMPSAFTVSGSPLTSNGTITVTGAGTTSQYVRGDGSLAAFPSVSNEAKTLIREVYNKTGATLTKGTVIYIDGGQGNLPTVTKAIATGDPTSAQTFGIVQSDITNMNNGFVVVAGGIDNLDTQAYPEGTALYLSPTTAGAWTSTKPYAPDHMVYLGVVVRSHPTQGVIEVKIQNGVELDEIHDVSARFPVNKDGLFYNSTSGVWENKSIAGVLGYTPVPESRIITINGTAQNLSADRTWNVGTVTSVAASGGTGISVAGSPVTGSGTITITNTAPDQVVGLTGAGTTSISGTYPNFTITSNDQYTGTVTSVAASGGTGISISGSPITSSGTINITNTAPDQIVSLTGAGTTSISGTYPNFTVTSNDQYVGTVTSVNATVPTGFEVSGVPITSSGTVDIKFASGYSLPTNAKQTQWDDAYAKRIDSLTVTGNSGSATLTSNVLNVPTYTLTGLGGEPAITAGTTSQYWRGDKSFQTLDTSVVPENGNVYFTEPRVRATVLSGLNITGGSISASDSVLNAFGKVQNQINGLIGGSIFQSTWNASTNTPTLASGVGTKGYYYIVSVAGTTNLDGITDWQIGDWAIFDGTVWRKVDNTDAVVSVNGFTGIVSLGISNLADVSASSPTDTQLLRFNGTTSKWYNWTPNYEPALTKGNLTEVTSSVLTITGGSNAVIGSGTTIQVKQASGSQSGFLSSTDWTTFNNKQNSLTNPVTGTGTLNYISKFTATGSTIGDSLIYDNGTNVSIGTATPLAKLHIQSSGSTYTSPENNNVAGIYVYNSTSNSTSAHSFISLRTNNANGGNPFVSWDINGVIGWSAGIDNADSDSFKIARSWSDLTSSTRLRITQAGIVRMHYYTTDGFVKFSNADGTLSVDTTTYQTQLNGTGFVKASGTTISYDNTSYLPLTGGTLTNTGGSASPILTFVGSATSSFQWMTGASNSALAAGNTIMHVFGKSNTTKNTGYIGFQWNADQSNDNFVTIGMFSADHLLKVFGNGNTTISGAFTSSISALGSAATSFVVSDDGTLKSRTAAQVLSDIGAASSSSLANYLPLAGNATMTGGYTISNANDTFTSPASTNVPIIYIYNSNNASTTAHSVLSLRTRSATGGNPFVSWDIDGVLGWSAGIDNADSDKFKISKSWNNISSNNYFSIDTNGNVNVTGTITASNFNGSSSGTNTGDQDLSGYVTLSTTQTISGAKTFTSALTVQDGRINAYTGGVNTYGILSGYGNNNHLITLRANISGATTTPTYTAGHQTCFVEYAESDDISGWFFKTSQTTNYTEIARITRTGINWNGNTVLHAGNYNSYALPLTGGTLTNTGGNGTPILTFTGSSNATFQWMTSAYSSGLAAGQTIIHMIGKSGTLKNAGYIGFQWNADQSDTNFMSIGMYSADHLLKIFGNGNIVALGSISGTSGSFSSTISASNFSGSSSGTNTGDQTTITGNAGTATKLETARNITINGTAKSFDGSAAISWTASEIGLTSYLPLAGGTLTGALGGTTANFVTSSNALNTTVRARNTNAGNAANASFALGNDVDDNSGGIALFGSGYTSTGQYRANGTYVYSNKAGGLTVHAEGNNTMYLATNGTTRFSVNGSGAWSFNSGGTINGRLTINNNTTALTLNRDAVTNYVGIYYSTAASAKWFIGMRENLSSDNYICYSEALSADVMTLNVTNGNATFGYAGIFNGTLSTGTSSTTSQFNVSGSTTSSTPIINITASGTGPWLRGVRMLNSGMTAGTSLMYAVGYADNSKNMGQFYFYYSSSGSNSNRLSLGMHSVDDVINIMGSGNVLIGTTSDGTGKLQVSGSVYATSFFESSDIRLKNVIEKNPKTNLKLDVLKFTRKVGDDKDQVRFGYSAQQVKELMPELVGGKEYLSVNYIDVHTLKIASLEEEIKQLKNKLNELGR